MKLYTFTISHFSEKARWALDLSGIPYEDVRLLPGPHKVALRRLGKHTMVPLLDDGGTRIGESSRILDYVDSKSEKKLTPDQPALAARAREFEALADHAFGLGVQRIGYAVLLRHRSLVTEVWAQDGPAWGRAFYSVAFPFVAMAVKQMYVVRPAAVERARGRFFAALDETDQALEKSPYLVGDRISRADVTVAALLAPLLTPPEHLVRWPSIPEEATALRREFEDRPTGRHVLRMYREHRKPAS